MEFVIGLVLGTVLTTLTFTAFRYTNVDRGSGSHNGLPNNPRLSDKSTPAS